MDPTYLVLGVLLLAAVSVDLLWTTLWVQGGAGPLTSRVMSLVWQTLRRTVGHRRRLVTLSGPLILLTSLALWIALLWGGWTMLFAGAERALVDTREAGPISWAERVYYVGYSIFTLGNGDFTPRDGVWQTATVLATASGMLFVTLSVTYVLSVLGAVTQKRAFASGVSGLGGRSDDVLRESWDGEAFRGLERPLHTFSSQLDTLTANHRAYPILHYFYAARAKHAPAVSIVVLDELLTVLRFGTPAEHRPNHIAVESTRSSVQDYLDTLHSAFVEPANRSPPSPELDSLRAIGVPTVSDEEFAESLEGQEERRRQLLGLIESDLREWPTGDDRPPRNSASLDPDRPP